MSSGNTCYFFIGESGPYNSVRTQGSPLLVKITVNVILRLGQHEVTFTSLLHHLDLTMSSPLG